MKICSMPLQRGVLLVGFLLAMLVSGGCGSGVGNDGDVVGGSCSNDRDCAGRCVTGGNFPGGICTLACDDDLDCPSGTACVDTEGGICLLLCNFDEQCRASYDCSDESRRGHPGSATVCIDD